MGERSKCPQCGEAFRNSFKYIEIGFGQRWSSTVADNETLQTVHGIIMWISWALLASYGITSSAARWIYPEGPRWFYIHRTVNSLVVLLTLIGFIVAILFMQRNQNPHFSETHHIIGLVVVILCVLQPINALFRVHPPSNGGWPKGTKPTKRVIWEYIHKISGYTAWILGGAVAPFLGLQMMEKDTLSTVHLVWCGLILLIFIILTLKNRARKREIKEVGVVMSDLENDQPQTTEKEEGDDADPDIPVTVN